MPSINPGIIKIIGAGFMAGGIISLIISVFDYKNNYAAALTGYFIMAIILIMLLMLIFSKFNTVNKALVLMNAFPFIIILILFLIILKLFLIIFNYFYIISNYLFLIIY